MPRDRLASEENITKTETLKQKKKSISMIFSVLSPFGFELNCNENLTKVTPLKQGLYLLKTYRLEVSHQPPFFSDTTTLLISIKFAAIYDDDFYVSSLHAFAFPFILLVKIFFLL
jgi:hypothetical protein